MNYDSCSWWCSWLCLPCLWTMFFANMNMAKHTAHTMQGLVLWIKKLLQAKYRNHKKETCDFAPYLSLSTVVFYYILSDMDVQCVTIIRQTTRVFQNAMIDFGIKGNRNNNNDNDVDNSNNNDANDNNNNNNNNNDNNIIKWPMPLGARPRSIKNVNKIL